MMRKTKAGSVLPETRNVRISFAGYAVPPDGKSALAVLPEERAKEAGFSVSNKWISAAALVRKGIKREECQDSAAIFAGEGFLAAGVFDGHGGPSGTFVSDSVANHLIDVCLEQGKLLAKNPNAKALLLDAANRLGDSTFPPGLGTGSCGGSTGMVALVLPDGRFSIAAIADSAVYLIGQRGVRRLLKYDTVHAWNSVEPVTGMDFDVYVRCRNIVDKTIDASGAGESRVESGSGRLGRGESLVLVSDGITKNLGIVVKADGSEKDVRDVSGCRDLRRIISGKRGGLANAIAKEICGRTEKNCAKKADVRIVVSENEVLALQDDDVSVVSISLNGAEQFK